MAVLVAFEGIDGSGKGTQAALFRDRARTTGLRCELIGFPRYQETSFGRAIGRILDGQFGPLEDVSPHFLAALFAGDRSQSRDLLLKLLASNDVVVADRFVASNEAHQAARLSGTERQRLVDQIRKLEYEIFELPRPDLVILLDVPVPIAQQLIAKKNVRTYTSKVADIQEADAAYLERVRELYLDVAQNDSTWKRIECVRDEQLRTQADIADEIWQIVSTILPR